MQSPNRSLDAVMEEDEGGGSTLSSAVSSSPSSSTRVQQAHTRKHSRIHERNLSAFFPRPGQSGEGYGGTYDDPHAVPFQPGVVDLPAASPPAGRASGGAGEDGTPTKSPAGRRGHHHRHSVSHNLFPFLDPADSARPSSSATKTLAQPRSAESQLPAPTSSFRQRYGHLNLFFQVLAYASVHVPASTRALLLVAVAQVVVGAVLWVQGQSGESLAVTGLGYLVVFDGLAGLSSVLLERPTPGQSVWDVVGSSKDASIRQPFGAFRLITLSHFSQAVYLLFSAVYVCKESVEHVLLLHDPQDLDGSHGTGHGGVGHGEGRSTPVDSHDGSVSTPRVALAIAILCAVVQAVAARNHQGLAVSLRSAAASREPKSRREANSASSRPLLLNPFTVTVILFAMAILSLAAILPSTQLAPVDKVLALLESLAMFYIASPAAAATGQILLQTSPHSQLPELRALNSAISQIESLSYIQAVEQRHVWQAATPASQEPGTHSSSAVATLVILAKHDASDADLLEATRIAQERVGRNEEQEMCSW
ncbi:hypothetical protein JCM8547_003902 [Rhodosporidiobolus lusitaniae]